MKQVKHQKSPFSRNKYQYKTNNKTYYTTQLGTATNNSETGTMKQVKQILSPIQPYFLMRFEPSVLSDYPMYQQYIPNTNTTRPCCQINVLNYERTKTHKVGFADDCNYLKDNRIVQ